MLILNPENHRQLLDFIECPWSLLPLQCYRDSSGIAYVIAKNVEFLQNRTDCENCTYENTFSHFNYRSLVDSPFWLSESNKIY